MNRTPMRTLGATPSAPNAVAAPTPVATPTAPDRPPQHDAGASRRFAEMLRARRSESAALAARAQTPTSPRVAGSTAARPASTADGCDDDAARSPSSSATSATKARAAKATGATGKAAVEHTHDSAGTGGMRTSEAARQDEDRASAAPTSTDARATALAALAAATVAPTAAADAPARAAPGDIADATARDAAVGDAATAIGADTTARGSIGARAQANVDVASMRGDVAAEKVDPRAVATFAEPSLQAASDGARAAHGAPATPADLRVGNAALGALSGVGVAPGIADAQGVATTTVALATPIDGPDFAAALGVQVTLLAQDGVQRAELHLNPAETGPVSIHIALDGSTARVDFGADFAATRHAIERGLPELASALRDAGLTLIGGSVSQHAGSRAGGEGGASRERAASQPVVASSSTTAADAATVRRVAAAGVDLYA